MNLCWSAKVHKSGTKVAVFKGSELVKVVESSKETFEPAEAQKFAEDLIATLQSRTSAQMAAPADQPAVTDTNELHSEVVQAVNTQAEGKGAGADAPVASPMTPAAPLNPSVEEKDGGTGEDEGEGEPAEDVNEDEDKFASEAAGFKAVISNLKKKLAQERSDRAIERKARRGLAIAKQLVVEGKLEDSYETIKAKIAQIVKLDDSEIERLERKVAGENEFASIEDAQKELRRQARVERINRQAAAEAQEDDDEEQAEFLDQKADDAAAKVAHIEEVISLMKTADDEAKKEPEEAAPVEAEEAKKEEKADLVAQPETAVPAEKDAASALPPNATPDSTPAGKVEEEKADAAVPLAEEKPEGAATDDKKAKLAELARTYRTVAANHRKLAESAEAEGDIETADKEDALGDSAEEKAEDIEKKLAECKEEKAVPEVAKDEEKADKPETPAEKVSETPKDEVAEEAKKEAAKKDPGKTVSSSDHSTLKREDGEVVDEFGIDKNASLVEQNDYTSDPEVEVLSKMWRGAPQD
jgi:hypothetical protein